MTEHRKTIISDEHIVYSKVLSIGIKIAFFILVISFIIYISGILHPSVPINAIPRYWNMSASDFCNMLHPPKGWMWLSQVGKGDCLNFIGITILTTLTILCHILVLPLLIKKKDIPYIIITILQILVLLLAASGVIIGKAH